MLQIVQTADGSNTIFNPEVGENYHSKHGALQESRHVFIKMGLEYFLDVTGNGMNTAKATSILEVGFGTGLNFLLTAEYCGKYDTILDYTGIEAYTLSAGMLKETGYDQYINERLWLNFTKNYTDALKEAVMVTDNCRLQIAGCKLKEFDTKEHFDIIYYDAFAAAYQPEMWDEQAISHAIGFLKPGGVFVTYAITGNLKRILKALGCRIEKVTGALGKREMLRAVKSFPL